MYIFFFSILCLYFSIHKYLCTLALYLFLVFHTVFSYCIFRKWSLSKCVSAVVQDSRVNPGYTIFKKKLQRQYLYLLQHLDSSLNTGPCLLKLLGVLALITVLLRLPELHLSFSFSWEAPPSQLPGSIWPSSPPSAPSSIWCRCTKSTSSWALASWCLSRATGAPPSPRVWLPLPHQLLRDQSVLLPVCVRETPNYQEGSSPGWGGGGGGETR